MSVSVIGLAFAKANDDPDGLQLTATVSDANGSGITGTATVSLGEDGLRGRLRAENLKPATPTPFGSFISRGTLKEGRVGLPQLWLRTATSLSAAVLEACKRPVVQR